MGIFDDIKDTAEDAFKKGKKTAGGGVDKLDDLKDTIKREVLDEVEKKFRDVRGEIGRGIDDIKGSVERKVKSVLEDIAETLASEAFKKYIEVLSIAPPVSAGLSLSIFSFSWDVTSERLDYLKKFAAHPKVNRDGFEKLLRAMGPETVEIKIDGKFALGVSSDALGVSGSVTWNLQTTLDKLDEIL